MTPAERLAKRKAEVDAQYAAEDAAKAAKAVAAAVPKQPKPKRARKMIASTMTPRAILRDQKVDDLAYKVAAAIADTINYGKFHDGQTTKVSQAELSRRYHVDEDAVNRAVKRLEALGYVEVDRRPGRGGTWFRFRPEACELAPRV